jgi:Sulfotransferase domain
VSGNQLRVVGAGLGRTGTNSLKMALEMLLGGSCYHMFELMQRREHLPIWQSAVRGDPVDWDALLHGYAATVDWPACSFWREISGANPGSVVLLSTRDPAAWWASMQETIVPILTQPAPPEDPDWESGQAMVKQLFAKTFTPDWNDRDAAIAAYERHNERVRREAPAGRLIDWSTGDGWEPICAVLDLPVPEAPFPHENRTEDFSANVEQHSRRGLEGSG